MLTWIASQPASFNACAKATLLSRSQPPSTQSVADSRTHTGRSAGNAARIKAEVGLPTIAVGLITEPEQAEAIVASGEADAVALARAMLYDPRWPWHAAARLGAKVRAPKQYWRSQPREYKDLFEGAAVGQR